MGRLSGRDRDLVLPPRHGRAAVFVLPAELDLKERPPIPVSYVFVLDASASCGPSRVLAVRGAAGALLVREDPGDRIGVVVVRGSGAEIVVASTGSAERAKRQLSIVPSGGRPPLAPGLRSALRMAAEEATRPDGPIPLLVLVSDGLSVKADAAALVPAARLSALGLPALVVDTSPGDRASALARLAQVMGAQLLRIPGVEANGLAAAARGAAVLVSREARWRAPRGRGRR